MYEKVNPAHPDKIADRIAGAMVDYAYTQDENPKVAVEVLIGHGECTVIAETSVDIPIAIVTSIVKRIAGENISLNYHIVPQDTHLANGQRDMIRCGDNGIFRGVPTTEEQNDLSNIVRGLYKEFPTDGKYIMDGDRIIACQSCVDSNVLKDVLKYNWGYGNSRINPLGDWTGGTDVDTGATNRKLGSDMGDAVTGGGLHGKDLSKADVSINIYAHIRAQMLGKPVELKCAIGDEFVDGLPYIAIVETARSYIKARGGFEKFAEWGLI